MAHLILELDDRLVADVADAAAAEKQSIEEWLMDTIEARLESEWEEEEEK